MPCRPAEHALLNRRIFLSAGGIGFCGLSLPALAGADPARQGAPASGRRIAKSTILIWLTGGPSHVDTWDMKPDAPREYRGEFAPLQTSAPEIALCEHLPQLARQAHHLAIVRSLGHYNRALNDHHTGYYYNLTGHAPEPGFNNSRQPRADDWPFIGCVVGAKRPQHPYLPQVVSLPAMAGEPGGWRPGQFAARLGVEHDPLYAFGEDARPLEFRVPSLTLEGDVSIDRLQSRQGLLKAIDQAERALDKSLATTNYSTLQHKAFTLLASPQSKAAFDVAQEPQAVRERYGPGINAMGMLLARRLVEAGVPFVTLFWKHDYEVDKKNGCLGGAWDTHWNNFGCLKNLLLPQFDRPFAALLEDLDQRRLLDETLVMVTSEMGRNPKIGDRRSGGESGSGRDHWTHCMSTLLAGGGVRGGQTYGTSDRVGAYPADKPVQPEDIAKTVYYAMGVEDLQAVDFEGRSFNLMDEGRALTELY